MSRRCWIALSVLLAACGSDQSLEHDLDPILLSRAPVQPGGPNLGGLLAKVMTQDGLAPLLVDSAFPYSSLSRGTCPSSPGWTYTGRMEIHDGLSATAPLRADFSNVGLLDICPGPSGDAATQAYGVLGGPLLSNFAVDFSFPRDGANPQPASMTLWPAFPGSDDQLAINGQVALRFEGRGSFTVAQGDGEASLTLPGARVVLAACTGPPAFAATDPAQTCLHGETEVRASGTNLLLAVGTGVGPTILSQTAWEKVAAALGLPADAGTDGELFTAFTTDQKERKARFVSLPRMALFQSTTDSNWLGPCAELARARRIEWTLANQDAGACFQPCDVSGDTPQATRPYLELGGTLTAAVVPDTSAIILSLNGDTPAKPHIDGIVGAATLLGTRMRIDYTATPQGRVIANCLDNEPRDQCFAAPACPGLGQGKTHVCFGHEWTRTAPACKQP
jgi:hypothetical protein